MVADDPESFADLDGHAGQECEPPSEKDKQRIKPKTSAEQQQPANAETVIAAFYRFGEYLAALGAVGNGAAAVKDATQVTGSAQLGNVQVDTKGESSAVVGVPAAAVNITVTVNGAKPDQKLIEQPAVGLGKFVQVGTDLVQEPNGKVHTQGGSLSVGVSTPTVPVSSAVPTGNVRDPGSRISRAIDAVKNFFRPTPGASPLSAPWPPSNPL